MEATNTKLEINRILCCQSCFIYVLHSAELWVLDALLADLRDGPAATCTSKSWSRLLQLSFFYSLADVLIQTGAVTVDIGFPVFPVGGLMTPAVIFSCENIYIREICLVGMRECGAQDFTRCIPLVSLR